MDDSVDKIVRQWAEARPGFDVSAMGVVGRLSRLSRHFDRELAQVFAEYHLQAGEFDLLATLMRGDVDGRGLTAGELAASAMVTSGAITNRLGRLVAKELVTRDMDPNSRRTIRISLTKKGRSLIDRALTDHVANEERLLEPLSVRQREQLQSLLKHLLVNQEGR